MRKDVILGMSIGGIVLAILVVYLTSSPSNKVKTTVSFDTGTGSGDVQGSGSGDADGSPDRTSELGSAAANRIASGSMRDATGGMDATPSRTDTARTAGVAITGSQDRKDPVWGNRLYGNDTPLIAVGQTPDGNTGGAPVQVAMSNDIRPAPGDVSTGNLDRNIGPSTAGQTAAAPTTKPAQPLTARQHKVAPGESFSSIAAAAYGSANYYPHILRANPGLDPRKLRPGMVINMPDAAQVKPAETPLTEKPVMALVAQAPLTQAGPVQSQSSALKPAADGTREYRVQSGDNLHRISIKAYGKISMVAAIYEANKQTIGPDMAKLKLGMLLKLPPANAPAAIAPAGATAATSAATVH